MSKRQNSKKMNLQATVQDSNGGQLLNLDFITNLLLIIDEKVPDMKYLAELFQLDEQKLNFIQLLNTLKHSKSIETHLEFLRVDKPTKQLLSQQGIVIEELYFLLKVGLNRMDYDSITQLLKILNLDRKIEPEILFNLLLIDLGVSD